MILVSAVATRSVIDPSGFPGHVRARARRASACARADIEGTRRYASDGARRWLGVRCVNPTGPIVEPDLLPRTDGADLPPVFSGLPSPKRVLPRLTGKCKHPMPETATATWELLQEKVGEGFSFRY